MMSDLLMKAFKFFGLLCTEILSEGSFTNLVLTHTMRLVSPFGCQDSRVEFSRLVRLKVYSFQSGCGTCCYPVVVDMG